VPEEQLPVELPTKNVAFKGKGSPLGDISHWLNVNCPRYVNVGCAHVCACVFDGEKLKNLWKGVLDMHKGKQIQWTLLLILLGIF